MDDKIKLKMRVWYILQVPGKPFYVNVRDEKEAVFVQDILAIYDQFQFQNKIKSDFCNASGVEIFNEDSQEWEDYEIVENPNNPDYLSFSDWVSENNIENHAKILVDENGIKF